MKRVFRIVLLYYRFLVSWVWGQESRAKNQRKVESHPRHFGNPKSISCKKRRNWKNV